MNDYNKLKTHCFLKLDDNVKIIATRINNRFINENLYRLDMQSTHLDFWASDEALFYLNHASLVYQIDSFTRKEFRANEVIS